jgi:hypothetical protein
MGFKGFIGFRRFNGFRGFNGFRRFNGFRGFNGFRRFNGFRWFNAFKRFSGFIGFRGFTRFFGFGGVAEIDEDSGGIGYPGAHVAVGRAVSRSGRTGGGARRARAGVA